MIKIPKFFHEILGEYQSKSALVIIALFVLISGAAAGIFGYDEWKGLSLVKQIVTWLLFLDIAGGVVANLTRGTDLFYNQHPKKRWIFIAIHIQPVILAWSMEVPLYYGVTIWIYTFIGAVFLNFIRESPFQSLSAGSLTGLGLLIVAYWGQTLPFLVSVLFIFYIFKVLFSFSVFHYKGDTK
ncbi:hypothetical protein [Alkalicoccus halolimnae]|uniref:Uncharacterized protein n=1 Tax=Alkalicoccus halolimnae TaxID=1667239 RepID=A0A5C7FFI3_9BACI|nr:hypothetical protein [Alkalicoccus halolimnae]TXF84670.1 hypothetical protein FTX54_10750 [Alkalicoccus halolimnae]